MMEQTLPTVGGAGQGTAGGGGSVPTIVRLDLFAVRVPFSSIARRAMDESPTGLGMAISAEEPWDAGDFTFARLEDEEGTAGWGEVFTWLPETGVSPAEILTAVPASLARYVVGARTPDLRAVRTRMDRNVARNEVAKGLLDLAHHDLAARRLGVPVHDLVGGRVTDAVDLCALVPLADPDTVVAICAGYVAAGYRTLRLKLGTSPEVDRDVLAAVRSEVGDAVRLRIDLNQAYDRAGALRMLGLVEPYGVEAVEQPLAVADLLGMVELQRRTGIPLFLHEGAFDRRDVLTLLELGGCGVVGVNAERPGGFAAAVELVDVAAAHGLGAIAHNQPLGLGSAVLAHLAAARADRMGHAVEIAGDVMFDLTLVAEPPRRDGGRMAVPEGPGWGVEVDRGAVEDHLAAAPVTVTIDDLRR